MSQRSVSLALACAGVLLLLVSLAADPLGIGGAPGFGWKQILGSLLGSALAITGGLRLRRQR